MAFLWTRDNPFAPLRANGRRFWGYPTRSSAIRVVGLHTAESPATSRSALNVATWQRDAARVPSSYHVLVDSHNTVVCLPDSATAFHIAQFNSPSLGLSFATYAHLWGKNTAWDDAAIERAAQVAAGWCRRYQIPAVWLSSSQARRGLKGFVRHSQMDPKRRSDPGGGFPASQFMSLVKRNLGQTVSVPKPPSSTEWTFVNINEATLRHIIRGEVRKVVAEELRAPGYGRLLDRLVESSVWGAVIQHGTAAPTRASTLLSRIRVGTDVLARKIDDLAAKG